MRVDIPLRTGPGSTGFSTENDRRSNLLGLSGGDGVIDMELLSVIRRW